MPRSQNPTRVLKRIRAVLNHTAKTDGEAPHWSVESLTSHTRERLVEAAKLLAVTGYSRLRKEALAERLLPALRELGDRALSTATGRTAPAAGSAGGIRPSRRRKAPAASANRARSTAEAAEALEADVAASKFDLGPEVKEPREAHIPWGYAHDRITAMAIDPDRLYCYWEVTDDAIEAARERLGPGGPSAWLSLRIYDVTDRIFDGTNAHAYFDIRVERSERQWFVTLNKPTSTQVVEVGLKSYEGYFVRITRSHRVDMPRKAPAAAAPAEWLTVLPESGEVEGASSPQPPSRKGGSGGAAGGKAPRTEAAQTTPAGGPGGPTPIAASLPPAASVHFTTVASHTWLSRSERFEWAGPVRRTSWHAGPFPLEVEAPGRIEERFEGTTTVYADEGGGRVVYGPWEVVIHGLAGWAEGRVVGQWQVYKSWPTESGHDTWSTEATPPPGVAIGGVGGPATSPAGASERWWGAGSEQRLGGASEIYRLGASEMRLGGASEQRWAGASELRLVGGSEQVWGGASELSYLGGSERIHLGGSEARLSTAGASENLGGSEARLGHASGEGRWPA